MDGKLLNQHLGFGTSLGNCGGGYGFGIFSERGGGNLDTKSYSDTCRGGEGFFGIFANCDGKYDASNETFSEDQFDASKSNSESDANSVV